MQRSRARLGVVTGVELRTMRLRRRVKGWLLLGVRRVEERGRKRRPRGMRRLMATWHRVRRERQKVSWGTTNVEAIPWFT